VTVTASEDYAPSAGQDIYGVFIFPTSLPANGTVTFDTVPNFISIGTPDNFIFTDVESPQSSGELHDQQWSDHLVRRQSTEPGGPVQLSERLPPLLLRGLALVRETRRAGGS
jgi:hypothetical protein